MLWCHFLFSKAYPSQLLRLRLPQSILGYLSSSEQQVLDRFLEKVLIFWFLMLSLFEVERELEFPEDAPRVLRFHTEVPRCLHPLAPVSTQFMHLWFPTIRRDLERITADSQLCYHNNRLHCVFLFLTTSICFTSLNDGSEVFTAQCWHDGRFTAVLTVSCCTVSAVLHKQKQTWFYFWVLKSRLRVKAEHNHFVTQQLHWNMKGKRRRVGSPDDEDDDEDDNDDDEDDDEDVTYSNNVTL